MDSIAFLRNNSSEGALADPFRFYCKLDELANVLLTNDSFLIISYGYEELPSLAHWLGMENLQSLVENNSLRFVLMPLELASCRTGETEFHFVLMDFWPDVEIHSFEPRLELLRKSCSSKFIPDGFSMPDDLATLIAQKSWAAGRDHFSSKLVELLMASMKILLEAAEPALPSPISCLHKKIKIEGLGNVLVQDGFSYEEAYREAFLLAGALRDIIVSFYFGVPLIHTSQLISSLAKGVATGGLLDEKPTAFREIIDLHGLPYIGSGAYSGLVSGELVMNLRARPDAKQFRRWLADTTSTGEDTRQILASYLEQVTEVLPESSIVRPAARLVTTIGLGILNTPLGAIASIADFAFSRRQQRPEWKPNFFVRGDYEQTLSQSQHQGARIPVDVSFLLNRGYRITHHQARRDGSVRLNLEDSPNSSINLDYSSQDSSYWRSNLLDIIEKAGGATFHFECEHCGSNSRIVSPGKAISNPKCGKCSKPLF